MGLFGPPDINKLKAKRDVPGLIRALAWEMSKDEDLRRAAAVALGELGDPRAVQPLVAALDYGSDSSRRAAAEALGKIGDARAVQPLLAGRTSNSEQALLKIGSNAVEPLVAALNDQTEARNRAIQALGKIGDARAVAPLVAALTDESEWTRKNVAEALGSIGDARAVAPLVAALSDKSDWVRQKAAEALGKIGDGRAAQPLAVALKDEDSGVRRYAAQALDRLGKIPDRGETGAQYWVARGEWDKCVQIGAPAVAALVAALRDHLSAPAAEALGRIGDARAVGPLVDSLEDQPQRDDLQIAAAKALAQIGDPRAVAPLIVALRAHYWGVRKAAAEALAMLYRSGTLERRDHDLLLAQRGLMAARHDDAQTCTFPHTDTGIGVEFPL